MFWLVINKSCQRQTRGVELNVSNANTQLPAPSPTQPNPTQLNSTPAPRREEAATAPKVPGQEMSRTKLAEHENKTSQFHV